MKYKLIKFYPRQHQPEFNTLQEAEDFIKSRALTSKAACYTELWAMKNEGDGEMIKLFDYGTRVPMELINK